MKKDASFNKLLRTESPKFSFSSGFSACKYNQDYFQKRDALPLHFAQTLELLLKEIGVKKILDVGCGTGRLVKFLKENGFEALGCDISDEAIKLSGQIKASACALPFRKKSFEAVTAVSLIEHLKPNEAEKFLSEAERVLKPKGYLFLVTPNFWSLARVLKRKKWFGYTDPTHLQFYSPFSLKRLLKKCHFSNFRFRFKVDQKTPSDWPIPLPRLPQIFQFLLNYLLISSPLAYLRDSFWLLAQK